MAEIITRPLRRCKGSGVWQTRDGRWTIMKHWGDPAPQRWFAYLDDDDWPMNDGEGHVRLCDVVDWIEYYTPLDPEVAERLASGPPV